MHKFIAIQRWNTELFFYCTTLLQNAVGLYCRQIHPSVRRKMRVKLYYINKLFYRIGLVVF